MDNFSVMLSAGLAAVGIAAVAWLGDRRRMRRSDPDAVGFMPWTGLFVWALLIACILLGLSARQALVQ